MDNVTVRELREKSGEIWQRVQAGEEFVVTRNGKPFALLVHTEPTGVEDGLRAFRAAQMGVVVKRMQAHAQTTGASELTEEEIQAEIDAARRELAAPRMLAAEPPAPPNGCRG